MIEGLKQKHNMGDHLFMSLLEDVEDTMHMLYAVFNKHIPVCQDTWLFLVNEELKHKAMVHRLSLGLDIGEVILNPDRPTSGELQRSLQYLRQKTATWDQWGIDAKEAFSLAISMEGSYVEELLHTKVLIESEALAQRLAIIADDSTKHGNLLRKAKKTYNRRFFFPRFWLGHSVC